MYEQDIDPWKFETSEYEANKYAATIAALPEARYQNAFEIGGSIGVLTEMLAQRCDSLLSIDVVKSAQEKAIQRCQHLPHVRFELLAVPDEYPDQAFDLIVLSEVGYYWCMNDLQSAQQQIVRSLLPGGHLLLVHWTPLVDTNPLTGDQVHDSFLTLVPEVLRHQDAQRHETYRLDLLERTE